MILQNCPIKFRGTIKRISPEQAKQLFNYDMSSGAKGVTFYAKGNKTIIMSYCPEKHITKTKTRSPEFQQYIDIFKKTGVIAHQISSSILSPVWTKMLKNKKYSSGCHMFLSVNAKRLLSGIENILFTIGRLPSPQIDYKQQQITDDGKQKILTVKTKNAKPDYKTGLIIMDSETLKITHTPPVFYSGGIISVHIRTQNPMVFLYYQNQENYSPSIRISPLLITE
jgi:hypothetical protein